jgi:hypothetical protein
MILLKNKNGDVKEFNNISEIGMGFANWINISDTDEAKSYLLQKAITAKLAELEAFHDSDAARIFYVKTPKNTFTFSTLDKQRAFIAEQISFCENSIKSGFPMNQMGYTHKQTHPITKIVTSEFISLANINWILANLGNIVNKNYDVKVLTHIPNINALKTIVDVEKYDFKAGYLLNQIITLK